VAAKIPQMTVLGIAGPGDPLANPERTLATFRALSEKAPDIKLCVSTNGLALPELVDEICKHNIDHVTITINCVDPEVGAKIYPWIFWNNRRIKGVKAAKILIEQQQKGLEMLVRARRAGEGQLGDDPGVNDQHLKEVSRVVKAKGAFLHNVMPLIAEAEHGTFYGLMGQRGPTHDELQAAARRVRRRHGHDAPLPPVPRRRGRHARRGPRRRVHPGQDRAHGDRLRRGHGAREVHAAIEANREGAAQASPPARPSSRWIAQAPSRKPQDRSPGTARPARCSWRRHQGGGVINQHFGHAREFLSTRPTPPTCASSASRVDSYCTGGDTCGDAETALARKTIRTLDGCEVVLCSKIGIEPWEQLEAAGIMPNGEHAMEPIEDAVAAVYPRWRTVSSTACRTSGGFGLNGAPDQPPKRLNHRQRRSTHGISDHRTAASTAGPASPSARVAPSSPPTRTSSSRPSSAPSARATTPSPSAPASAPSRASSSTASASR
jgi:nitrogen fixation protein NifB